MVNVKDVQLGTTTRKSFAKINEVMKMPNLIEVQKSSYRWFLEEGLKEVFKDIGEISDYTGNLVLDFVDFSIDDEPKYSIAQCKARDTTYARPLKVRARLVNKETGEIKENTIFMGDLPWMTDAGTFVINGAERCIVSQLVRSPGVYYNMDHDKTGKELFTNTVIPNRGAWLEYETDANDLFYVRIDKNRKIYITTFLRALGLGTDSEIVDFFGEDEKILATIDKDTTKNTEEALLEVYKKLRPGEPPTLETAQAHLDGLFFDAHRYDLSRVGRYKYNKKLSLSDRLKDRVLTQPIISPQGEFLADAGEKISEERAVEIENAGVMVAFVDADGKEVKIVSNGMVDIYKYVDFDCKELGIHEMVSYRVLSEILEKCGDDVDALKEEIERRADDLVPKHITTDDIFASVSYLINLANGVGTTDDIDHLGNRRIRAVGELLQNQFRIGFTRMERVIRERMTLQAQDDDGAITPQALINIRPVVAAIKEFFGSSPLSQFMDQNNPLAELTHKRRLSALGPGGLSRDRAGFEVRDVHYTHYGRMCPIETPEGPNIGLISYLACYSRLNEYGFIEAPYRKVDKETGVVTDEVVYMTADVEDNYVVAQANEPLDENGRFTNARVTCRCRDEFLTLPPERVDYMDVSPKMVVSVATAMIPFLENDDANRALMGSNMQCQAVPLLTTDSPIVGTGIEHKIAKDSGSAVLTKEDGVVEKVAADQIVIKGDSGIRHTHKLIKFARSNQSCCINYRPIVKEGERVKRNDIIADGPAMDNGELALGKNILIGFMTWEGYNYEDAVLISEELVKNDVFTSIHVEEYECEARDTKLGPEEITRDIPNVSEDTLKDLDEQGIIRIGAEVHAGDILVGKVTPKGETELTAEERLLRAIFGEKAREVRDTSLRVPHGEQGIIIDVKKFTRENGDELSPGVNEVVRCVIAQKRKISVGDKMAGRHGNKGVVSRVLPQEDMPFLEDGTPLQIVLNPLGVPSRMNIGQVLEMHLGYAYRCLSLKTREQLENTIIDDNFRQNIIDAKSKAREGRFIKLATPVFDGAQDEDIKLAFKEAGLRPDFKSVVYDGRTGEKFDNPVTVGVMYYLKLHHLVDDKIHARSTGPYSLVTQQPLGGKAQFGGQRFGEMEVWALEAYGAAYTLQEILTVKSDDIVGRVKTYEAIVKGENIPKSGIPESFKVLVKELQSLALDIKILNHNMEEIDLDASFEDEDEGVVSEELVQTMEDKDGITDTFDEDDLNDASMVLDDSDENDFGVDDSDDIDFNDDDEI